MTGICWCHLKMHTLNNSHTYLLFFSSCASVTFFAQLDFAQQFLLFGVFFIQYGRSVLSIICYINVSLWVKCNLTPTVSDTNDLTIGGVLDGQGGCQGTQQVIDELEIWLENGRWSLIQTCLRC